MSEQTATGGAPAQDSIPAGLLKLAGAIMLGSIVMQLDATMVNVAFNTLLHEFHSTLPKIQWIGTGYMLAMALTIPATGWAVARFGSRRVWIASIGLFLFGSMLCGIAWSADSLIAFRVVQGLGAGTIIPLAQMILAQAAGPRYLGRVMAAIGIPAILGPVLGPVLGGVIVDQLSWRWIFFVNLPICLAAIAVSRRVVPDTPRAPGTNRLDLTGLVLLSPGLAVLVYGLSEAAGKGSFTDPVVLGTLAGGAALVVGFVVHAVLTRAEPLIDLALFRSRSFSMSSLVVLLSGMPMFAATVLVPLYYQQVRGDSPLVAGLLLAPQGIGMGIALVVAGGLSDRMAPRPIVMSGLVLAGLSGAMLLGLAPHTSTLFISSALVLGGAGLGCVLVPVTTAALRGLDGPAVPRATTAIRIFQQLGGSLGLAVLIVVLQQQLTVRGGAGLAGIAASYAGTFWWVVALSAVAVVPALFLPRTAPAAQGAPREEVTV
ncbi:DHA2 family efflux MFS transporter permease subunit [Nonomuraea zeae]|uniref:DHA2 family efflux MFS transporter permease subunit n=1 Tax=Nonomuraea zeae TaxID=1642303 RepID=A0A5S4H920_9ACTN|nr:DHA2 family efflux MFS transporter permease subunit [Nonomuraea zeae]TMR35300.1 DHA2 family efflux MFS transporter permease subunit [Nonomuraea zeae]